MSAAADRKVVLITRKTRLEELVARYHTLAQARFYIEHLGADFTDYAQENLAYGQSLRQTLAALRDWGRHQVLDRALLPNFVFAPDDIVVALGQDGLVANTMKYLEGQPLIGVNPEPGRWDGVLLPFEPGQLAAVLKDAARDRRPAKAVTMAQARLSDGQTLRAVNDLFIGPRSHASALYDITLGGKSEQQSSSGVIVSTGLGSTAWLKSIMTGSMALAAAAGARTSGEYKPMDWDANQLTFAVREPFPARRSQATLVYGQVTTSQPLILRSRMPEQGVIFSDGMEADFLRFTAGIEATVSVAKTQGMLVV
jgi:NAD kinase